VPRKKGVSFSLDSAAAQKEVPSITLPSKDHRTIFADKDDRRGRHNFNMSKIQQIESLINSRSEERCSEFEDTADEDGLETDRQASEGSTLRGHRTSHSEGSHPFGLHIGDMVDVKDDEFADWASGEVIAFSSGQWPVVQRLGWDQAYEWQFWRLPVTSVEPDSSFDNAEFAAVEAAVTAAIAATAFAEAESAVAEAHAAETLLTVLLTAGQGVEGAVASSSAEVEAEEAGYTVKGTEVQLEVHESIASFEETTVQLHDNLPAALLAPSKTVEAPVQAMGAASFVQAIDAASLLQAMDAASTYGVATGQKYEPVELTESMSESLFNEEREGEKKRERDADDRTVAEQILEAARATAVARRESRDSQTEQIEPASSTSLTSKVEVPGLEPSALDIFARLVALQQQPENAACADCPSPHPTCASAVLAIFVCKECATVHRALGASSILIMACLIVQPPPPLFLFIPPC
jgi:hypothetical protein